MKARLEAWLEDKIIHQFASRILAVDLNVALAWGQLQADLQPKGVKLPVIDGLLAATALSHRLTIVTRNTRDFAAASVHVVNPWT